MTAYPECMPNTVVPTTAATVELLLTKVKKDVTSALKTWAAPAKVRLDNTVIVALS